MPRPMAGLVFGKPIRPCTGGGRLVHQSADETAIAGGRAEVTQLM